MAGDQTQHGARRLARLLTSTPDPSECQRCLDAIEDYCAAQQAGADVASLFPTVADHLDACVACAEAYALVYEALLDEGREPVAGAVPTADLSFLGSGRSQPATQSLGQALAGAIEQAGNRLRVLLSLALIELAQPQQPGLALRSAGEGQPLAELTWEAPGASAEQLQVALLPAADPSRCDVRVRVALAGRGWPDLEGTTVRLDAGGQQQVAATDAWGEALFRSVARASIDQLVIEVEL